MDQFTVTFLPEGISVPVTGETTLLQAQIAAGLRPDAPCGGKGTCGKCSVIINGETHLACRTKVHQNMTVRTKGESGVKALTEGCAAASIPDGADKYVMAFDVGTTTVVAYLLDGYSGKLLARESCVNPQVQFGADVISRIQYALRGGREAMSRCIRTAMEELVKQTAEKAGIAPEAIGSASIAGNTAMHHLLLNIDPKPLVTPPYMPAVSEALELTADCRVRVLPNIAGFVGGDTVGCMIAAGFDTLEELTLLIDIGTNGEMVLGNKNRRIACSTAAGPAFEGANILLGLLDGIGVAFCNEILDDSVVNFHIQITERFFSVFRFILRDPCGNTVILVVIKQNIQPNLIHRIDHCLSRVGHFSGKGGFADHISAHKPKETAFLQAAPVGVAFRLCQTGKRSIMATFCLCPHLTVDLTDLIRTIRINLPAQQRHGIQSPLCHGLLQILLTNMGHNIAHAHQFFCPGTAVQRQRIPEHVIPFPIDQADAIGNIQSIHQIAIGTAEGQIPLVIQCVQHLVPPVVPIYAVDLLPDKLGHGTHQNAEPSLYQLEILLHICILPFLLFLTIILPFLPFINRY